MLMNATIIVWRGLQESRHEFFLITNFENQGNTQRQIANYGFHQATNTLSVPSLKPPESRQLDLAAFYLSVPITDVSISCFHCLTPLKTINSSRSTSWTRICAVINWCRRVRKRSIRDCCLRSWLTIFRPGASKQSAISTCASNFG